MTQRLDKFANDLVSDVLSQNILWKILFDASFVSPPFQKYFSDAFPLTNNVSKKNEPNQKDVLK